MNILLTSAGGKFIYQIVSSLKKNNNNKIYGTDINTEFNNWYLEKLFKIPRVNRNNSKFIKTLLKICKDNKINFIIPCSDIEALEITKHKDLFDRIKVKYALSPYRSSQIIYDKFKLYQFLCENKICNLKWFKINDLNNLTNLVNKEFINKRCIIKPSKSTGARNSIIINNKLKKIQILNNRNFIAGNLKLIKEYIIKKKINLKGMLLMEYLEGSTYDVDIVSKNGKKIVIVSRLRIWKNKFSPVSEGCEIVTHKNIEKLVEKILSKLKLNGPCDLDIIEKNNKLFIIDASCRLSGSVGASISSGINIPDYLINLSKIKLKKKVNLKKKKFFPILKFVNN